MGKTKLLRNILIIIGILQLIFTFIFVAPAQHFGLNLGDSYPQSFKDKYGKLKLEDTFNIYREKADKICASNTFEDIEIEYTFIYGELGSIKMIALNDENNAPSNKLILMNYAKTNYGEFDTGTNPQSYNYYYITNKKYRYLISSARAFEEGTKEVVK